MFNSSYNQSDWGMENLIPSGHKESKLPNTCLGRIALTTCEFKLPLLEEDIVELSHKNFSVNMMRQIQWGCQMYREWHHYRYGLGFEHISCMGCQMYREWHHHRYGLGFEHISCDLEDKAAITVCNLKFALI